MKMTRAKFVIGLGLMMIILSGCAKNTVVIDFCSIYKPVFTSPADTELTRDQVDENNAVYDEKCI